MDNHAATHDAPPHSSLRQIFLSGLLALLPVFITWKILTVIFHAVDGPLGVRIDSFLTWLARALPGGPYHIPLLSNAEGLVHVPGLGILATIGIVLGMGWLARLVIFRWAFEWFERSIAFVPGVGRLYHASRQIVTTFTEARNIPFTQVVIAEYPMVGRYTLGLLAKERLTADPDDDRVVVFFPSNHLHLGYPVLMPRKDVQPVDMPVEDAIKFFVSCGVIGDDKLVTWKGQPVNVLPEAAPEAVRAAAEAPRVAVS
jgi:uncharacterized membrane protein